VFTVEDQQRLVTVGILPSPFCLTLLANRFMLLPFAMVAAYSAGVSTQPII
jgi:hypothetical protein